MKDTIREFCFPDTVREALSVMNRPLNKTVVLAGGTRIARLLPSDAECVVDIRNLPLKHIKTPARQSKWLTIGAACTFTELEKSSCLKKWAGGIIASAAARGSSHLMRNMATVGGNIVRPYPFNNLPPVFLALDAHAVITDRKGTSVVPFARLHEKEFLTSLGKKSLLVEVKIPARTKNWSGVFEKLSKAETDWESYVNVAVALGMTAGSKRICTDARIVLGSITPRALRFTEAEKILEGKDISDSLAEQASEAVLKELNNIPTVSLLKGYRKHVAGVMVKRCILRGSGMAYGTIRNYP